MTFSYHQERNIKLSQKHSQIVFLLYLIDKTSYDQYSCLENPMGGGAWWAAVHGVAKSRTQPSYFTFTFHFYALEKEMATPPSVLGLENPRDEGAWWAAVYGVAQSQTRLKRLSSSSSSNQAETLLC